MPTTTTLWAILLFGKGAVVIVIIW